MFGIFPIMDGNVRSGGGGVHGGGVHLRDGASESVAGEVRLPRDMARGRDTGCGVPLRRHVLLRLAMGGMIPRVWARGSAEGGDGHVGAWDR